MMWFVTRRRYDDDLAAAKSEIRRQRERAEAAGERATTAEFNRSQILDQNTNLTAANQLLRDRVTELEQRLAQQTEATPKYTAHLEQRIEELTEDCRTHKERADREARRADHLQERLDDACGLGKDRIANSGPWQPGYQPPKKEAAS